MDLRGRVMVDMFRKSCKRRARVLIISLLFLRFRKKSSAEIADDSVKNPFSRVCPFKATHLGQRTDDQEPQILIKFAFNPMCCWLFWHAEIAIRSWPYNALLDDMIAF